MQTDQIQIRPAVSEDARVLAEIHVESWRVAYVGIMPQEWLDRLSVDERETLWAAGLAAMRSSTLIACSGGEPIGWIDFGRCRDDGASPRCGEVYGFYLRPAYWHRGIGVLLWRAAIERLAADGFSESVVWTLEQNVRARKFYERMGTTLSSGITRLVGREEVQLVEVRYEFMTAGCRS